MGVGMSMHTQGPITFREDGDANHWSMLTKDGRWLLSLLANGEQTSPGQIANFRRLVACWNACEGLSTESLERMPGTFAQAMAADFLDLWAQYADAKAQRDELLEALRGMLALDEEHHQRGDCDDDVCAEVRKALAAIAKVTGEAT